MHSCFLCICVGQCWYSLQRPCNHHGYQDPLDCTRCRCPDGWTGRYCDDLAPSSTCKYILHKFLSSKVNNLRQLKLFIDCFLNVIWLPLDRCGGRVTALRETQYLSSPGYNQNVPYEDFQQCNWLITVGETETCNTTRRQSLGRQTLRIT